MTLDLSIVYFLNLQGPWCGAIIDAPEGQGNVFKQFRSEIQGFSEAVV